MPYNGNYMSMKERVEERQAARQNASVSPYELFVAAVSILSIVNIFIAMVFDTTSILYVIGIIDGFISIFFFIDFLQRLFKAESKSRYFFKEYGWADLAASIPLPKLKLLRLFRLFKAYRIINQVGAKKVVRDFFKNPAASALYLILFLIILLLEFGSIAILYVEGSDPAGNIKTASDAIWWVYVTITTVGYGDKYPVTNDGRLIGMLVMLAGVGLFGVLTGFLANRFLPSDANDKITETNQTLQSLTKDLETIKNDLAALGKKQ